MKLTIKQLEEVKDLKDLMIENIAQTSNESYKIVLKGYECSGWDYVLPEAYKLGYDDETTDYIVEKALIMANKEVDEKYRQELEANK